MSASNWADCPQCGEKNNLREDYEIYMEDGVVKVDYSCSCKDCGFRDSFAYEYQLKIDATIMKQKKLDRINQIQEEKQLLDDELAKLGGTP